MMHANEARELALGYAERNHKLLEVLKAVRLAATEGLMSVNVRGRLSDNTFEALVALGYDATEHDDHTTIVWY